ncbi:MAG: hypothetical protein JWQ42_3815 [Edaphobacter sp.]|nr:hypothetical protein [Edaphobacter sp.]
MQLSLPIRLTMVTCLSMTALLAQSRPASRPKPSASSAPAVLPAALPTTDPAPLPLTPAQRPAHRAEIAYTDNRLTVSASNSSLNQILREISRLTGIKITGGVTEERVFGDYGPAAPSQVLATLLDGTGSNVLLVQSSGSAPPELILTPRQGGATPPNPNALGFDDSEDSSEVAPPNPVAQPIRPPSQYAPRPMTPNEGYVPEQNTTAPNPQSTDPAQQASPNAVKTPQQIYDQLQQLRQQQQQKPPQ